MKNRWNAILEVARIISNDNCTLNNESTIRQKLRESGFKDDEIFYAMDWFDRAQLSGNITEILSMIEPPIKAVRIEHPIEKAYLSDEIIREISVGFENKFFGFETAEKLLEGMRALDPRDWEDHDIRSFVVEILSLMGSEKSSKRLKKIRKGRISDLIC